MTKRFFALFLAFISVFLLCSCEAEMPKTATSISTTFEIEGVKEAKAVIVTAKEKGTGEKIKIKIKPNETKTVEIEPGTYLITNVSSGDKRIIISINEQYFTVNKSHKNISFSIKEEDVKGGLEWFLYNNKLYLLGLVGCSVFLGIHKYKKEKALNMK